MLLSGQYKRTLMKLELCNYQVPLNQKGSVTLQLSDAPEFLLHLQCCLTSSGIKNATTGNYSSTMVQQA